LRRVGGNFDVDLAGVKVIEDRLDAYPDIVALEAESRVRSARAFNNGADAASMYCRTG
jgi:hypothetical protein